MSVFIGSSLVPINAKSVSDAEWSELLILCVVLSVVLISRWLDAEIYVFS